MDTKASILSNIQSVFTFPQNFNLFLTALCLLEKEVISLSAPEPGFFLFLILPFKTLEGINVSVTDTLQNFVIPSP